MIIDSITHVTESGQWFQTPHDASLNTLLTQMDQSGVSHAVVVAMAEYIDNAFVHSICSQHADKLFPVASINPVSFENAKVLKDYLRTYIKDRGYVGIKLHPRLGRYLLCHDMVFSFFEEVQSWNRKPAIWLCSFLYFQGACLKAPAVETIHEIVGRYPGLNFIVLHGAGPDILHMAHAVRDCKNTFLDLSYTLSYYKNSRISDDIRFLVNKFDKRLVFGSDFPEWRLKHALDDLNELLDKSKEEARDAILGKNMLSIIDQTF